MTYSCQVKDAILTLSKQKGWCSNMNYDVIYLEEKMVVGQSVRTSNNDPDMSRIIGELWQGFFAKGIFQSIANKKNATSIGLYNNYRGENHEDYQVMVCCEVEGLPTLSEGMQAQTIPAGKYAKFIVTGDMQKVVADFWVKLWSMELDRKFSCDFEEYQSGSDMEKAEIHIYISLN